jgi:hypothetical protein
LIPVTEFRFDPPLETANHNLAHDGTKVIGERTEYRSRKSRRTRTGRANRQILPN